ncbi:MAG: DUF3047 domain-containing protein [Pseudomonadales bacterium]|nr:DUF3047 domain-containing protein [Pseudomonadales bacterium]
MSILMFTLMCTSLWADTEDLAVGNFAENALVGWEVKVFSGKTDYDLVTEIKDTANKDSAVTVLRAISDASASGLVKKIRVDLKRTPFLEWRWKVTKRILVQNEMNKEQDDYAARIYVIVDGGFFAWNTMALNYVWANGVEKEARWDNAFAPKHSKMIALRSKDDAIDYWYTEKRDVREDFKRSFGEDVRYIDVIAIMSDTDNSSSSAESYYGDIVFTKD